MRTVCVINQKGGSCKTATTVNVAAALGEQDRRVLVIDLDPQASSTRWLGSPDDTRGLLEAFLEDKGLAHLVVPTVARGVDLVPSSSWLSQLERSMAGEAGAEMILRRALQGLPEDRWDLVLVDCPPALGFITVSALTACNELLVPLESPEALDGLKDLLRTVARVKERLNPSLTAPRVLLSRVQTQTRLWKELAQGLRARLGTQVMTSVVHDNIKVKEAYSNRVPVVQYASGSLVASDFRSVALELAPRTRAPEATPRVAGSRAIPRTRTRVQTGEPRS